LCARLPEPLAARVIGDTGPARPGPRSRYREILAYLDRFAAEAPDWRALDDTPSLYPPGCPQLIACDPTIGIDAPQLRALAAWWRNPSG
jgi:hypothetical protein